VLINTNWSSWLLLLLEFPMIKMIKVILMSIFRYYLNSDSILYMFIQKKYRNIGMNYRCTVISLPVTLSATNELVCLARHPIPIHLITNWTAACAIDMNNGPALGKTRMRASARFLFRCASITHIELTNCISSKTDWSFTLRSVMTKDCTLSLV